ncbi:hypothetical protein MANES_02G002950v8 [Manihot esculenta]|uniref:Uncharacterized protein n=1 Tax=Manihot esculenta TaxID=3983 RepID=A0ACB7I4P1_MANES|nr:hypothetical protein MANES_02G002950v8 [Manihot esculenta]
MLFCCLFCVFLDSSDRFCERFTVCWICFTGALTCDCSVEWRIALSPIDACSDRSRDGSCDERQWVSPFAFQVGLWAWWFVVLVWGFVS